jgi:hypothetical protein
MQNMRVNLEHDILANFQFYSFTTKKWADLTSHGSYTFFIFKSELFLEEHT